MGWVWKDGEDDTNSSLGFGVGGIDELENPNPRSDDRCSTRRILKSQCKTEEVEPGKFVRKCEKTEQILRDCVGRPVEVVKSNTEYTEDDITSEMVRGGSFPLDSSAIEPFNFPGFRSDIEAIEKSMFGGFSRLFEAAEEMRNSFFQVFGAPHIDNSESSSSFRRGIPIEGQFDNPKQRNDESAYSDYAGLVRDV